jgi:sigma-B regulation protein RsbU (phosphoserine phosphatase)
MRILIADDNAPSRVLLSKLLNKLGYEVLSAADGQEAWEILQNENVNFVITDWLMPVMDGLELCKRIREADFSHYVYIMILTSKDEKESMIEGLEAGADDFIVKPYDKDELYVKIRAGERILQLEKDIEEKNNRLREAYSMIKKDLEAAAKIQTSLLPKSASNLSGIEFDWLFLPATYIAGDIFNYFRLVEDHIGFYLLDVAGHGIPSALLSVTLSRILSPSDRQDNPLKQLMTTSPYYKITQPSEVVSSLNQRFQADDDCMQYFTMIYGIIDAATGQLKLTQAGHPPPIQIKNDGNISLIGTGGYPVAVFPEAEYEEHELCLSKGDRLILYSDGVTECENNMNERFSTERLIELTSINRDKPLKELINNIHNSISDWNGSDEFEDDISLLAIEMT